MPLFGKKKAKPENRLEQLLLNAANDMNQRQAFYREFLDSEIFFIGEVKGSAVSPDGSFRTTEPTEFTINAIDIKGEKVGALFTSLARMQESLGERYKNTRWVRTQARHVLKALGPNVRVVLNPYGSFGHEFGHNEVKLLLEGKISELDSAIPPPPIAEYDFRKPVEYPTGLVQHTSRYFQERGDIKEAYLTEAAVPSRSEPWHLFIGIEVKAPGKTRFGEVLAGIDRIVKAIYPDGKMIDIVQIQSKEYRERWFAGVEPFYHA